MRHLGLGGLSTLLAIVVLAVFLPGTSNATECYWIHDPSTPGDWLIMDNWDPASPLGGDTAIIDNGGLAYLDIPWQTRVFSVRVGDTYAGSVTQSGSDTELKYTTELWLGYGVGASGVYTLLGGTLTGQTQWLGYDGRGTFRQSGGLNLITSGFPRVALGVRPGSVGMYDLSGGTLVADFVTVGSEGSGSFVQGGGRAAIHSSLVFGQGTTGSGTYDLQDGSLTTGSMDIGREGFGSFTQSGGSVAGGGVRLGSNATGSGTYAMSGGTLGTGDLDIGRKGSGTFLQTGGSVCVGGSLGLGGEPGVTGTYTLAGGSLVIGRGPLGLLVGDRGTGQFAQTGGTLVVSDYTPLLVGGWTWGAGTGTYTLSGGLLTGYWELIGGGVNGLFIQTGGTNIARSSLGVGTSAGGTGTYLFSGGTLRAGELCVGRDGTGSFNQSGPTYLESFLYVGGNAGGTGTYILSEGSLRATGLLVGFGGSGRFVQSGGTCHALQIFVLGWYNAAVGVYELSGGSIRVACDAVLGNGWGATALFHVTGGTLDTRDSIIFARGSAGVAELAVSRGAYVVTQGLTINKGEDRSTKVIVEVSPRGTSLIHARGSSTLAGVLDVQSLWDYRPKEGDKFTLIASSDPSGVYFRGDFATITSNITIGLQGLPAFAGAASGSDYVVTFQGLSAGDANGDHVVDGGDLALMGSTWHMAGQTWETCDFTGDGLVDGGDLALIGGNWMWSLPPAPSAALPEPISLWLLALGAAAWVRRREH